MQIKKTTILILIIAVSVVISGCVKKEKEQPVVQSNNEHKIEEQDIKKIATTTQQEQIPVWPDVSFTEEDYKGWKTYINEKLGYKIKYPPTWTINACDEGCSSKEVIINPPDAEMFIGYICIGLEGRAIDKARYSYLNPDFWEDKIYKEKIILFADKKAYYYYDGPHIDSVGIIIQNNNRVFGIISQKFSFPQVEQILASFKFLSGMKPELIKY